jgi:hypothetical protein
MGKKIPALSGRKMGIILEVWYFFNKGTSTNGGKYSKRNQELILVLPKIN